MFQLPFIFVNIIFFRTEFSSSSQSSHEYDLLLYTNANGPKCFDTGEIIMKKEFNPSANENPLQFNATLSPVETNTAFDGKSGKLVSGDRNSRVKKMSIPFEQGMSQFV